MNLGCEKKSNETCNELNIAKNIFLVHRIKPMHLCVEFFFNVNIEIEFKWIKQ